MTTTPEPSPSDHVPDYPVMLNVAGRRCLVVGGGSVAARRAQGLLAAGARVTVVAPDVVAAIDQLATRSPAGETGPPGPTEASTINTSHRAGTLEMVRRHYQVGEAGHYDMVVTATGAPEVDRAVVSDAISAGVLVNSADRGSPGTVLLPAVHRDGPVTVAVSTGGASPALARWLRDRFASSIPPAVATLAALLEEARSDMRSAGRPTESVDWVAALDEQVVPLVEAGRIDEARAALRGLCVPLSDAPGPE